VVAAPEVRVEPLGRGDEFCVVATDGLWDVMPSQQVVNFLRLRLWNHKDLERAARELTKEAVHGQKSLDNVSVVLVAFHQAVAPPGPLGGSAGSTQPGSASAKPKS
jgi:serine/threonine protein phosphatase PrpC